ncbi:bifunctional acetate--CoA ligase family protein/GNAT family N-acetyltransferase [Pelagibius marinus]|uniref:bifunctional acetate--CoA ligase family protein/GNAT family N-acetyltransferase n=1 Tax=Pelagibius marinus TaxID=2762760 RepID=UPI001872A276|nr:bifunctional acetate--CoA ligase family protein/GNAT family N-acetyltransferase [Pelagibius marinus]
MTIRNLDALFKPRSIALVGGSRRDGSLGAVLARNLFHGGFEGPILPLHRKHESLEGVLAYPSVEALPLAPDLAIIATPPDSVPQLIADFAARGTRAAVVITAGFGEGGDSGGAGLRQQMLDAARPHLLRIVGPNCLGMMVPGLGINASFSHIAPLAGGLAFVTQSGAMVTAMLDWATPRGIGFSKIVSLGDKADVDFGDLLDYLAMDPETKSILLYVESIDHARKFMSAARIAARNKPVIVIKGGRFAEGAKAAASHTGALAGADAVYDAVFARAGMLRVYSLEELFDAAETLANYAAVSSTRSGDSRLAILTNGGGLGVLATDALIAEGGKLAELAPETIAALDQHLPATWSRGNPVDIIGDAPGSRYKAAMQALLHDPNTDAVLAMHCPVAIADPNEAAEAVIEAQAENEKNHHRPVFAAWVGEQAVGEARRLFTEHHLPHYPTPEQAVRAFMHLERYRHAQSLLMRVPPSVPESAAPDTALVRRLVAAAIGEGREWLNEAEAKQVLAAYGIPALLAEVVATPQEAGEAAARTGGPVALKILSRDITHKSDLGGVALDLEGAEAVEQAAEAMLKRIAKAAPEARLQGFTVQAMCRRPRAEELILGVVNDAQFGPVMLFGQGGTAVEVIKDKALALPPLDPVLAEAMMQQTRVDKLLQGYRDRPPADRQQIAACLIRLSQLIIDVAEITEVDINPLLADSEGVIALDARIRLDAAEAGKPNGAARLAIRPYPKALEQSFTLPGGQRIFLRPLRPDDAEALREGFRRMDPEDVRMRFFAQMREMSPAMAARLTQLDYNREMALAAFPAEGEERGGLGVVRLVADPDNQRAEFAITIRSDAKGRGLGRALMERIMDYAVKRGIGEIWGDVLADNARMLALCDDLGFERGRREDGIVHVRRRLRGALASD